MPTPCSPQYSPAVSSKRSWRCRQRREEGIEAGPGFWVRVCMHGLALSCRRCPCGCLSQHGSRCGSVCASCFRALSPTVSPALTLPAQPWTGSGLSVFCSPHPHLHPPPQSGSSRHRRLLLWFFRSISWTLCPLHPHSGPPPLPALPGAPCRPQPQPSSHLSRAVARRGRCGRARRSSPGLPRRTCQV